MLLVNSPKKSTLCFAIRMFRILAALLVLFSTAVPLFPQTSPSAPPLLPPMWEKDPTITGTNDWDNWKRNCSDMVHDFGKDTFLSCATDFFRSRPFHFVAQSVVPGSGVGGGGYYGRDLNRDIWQNRLEFTGVLTIRQFWFTEAKFTARRPHFGDFHSDENFAFQIYARNKTMPTLPFYGLGPDTNVHASARFSQRDTRFGALVATPLASWLGISGTFESIWPNVGGVRGTNVVSIEQAFDETTAPGLLTQPNFLHYEAFLRPHFSLASNRFQIDYRFRYGYFQDTSTGHYSFRRFVSDFGHTFYPETEDGHRRLDSIITARVRISTASTGSGQSIPFYLQETIGGSDIDNQATLRSFRDYRFRGPNSFLVQSEFDRRLIGPVGLLVFYDAGKVTFARSDLNFSNLHQGFGGGLSFFLAGKVVFRMYAGFGGGEGVHPYFGIANFL
jgi:hypothetical protein